MSMNLQQKRELDPLFRKLGLPFSDYSFANCYLFQNVHAYTLEGNFLEGKTRDGFSFLMPLTYPFDIEAGPHFFPIPEAWLSLFDKERFSWQALPQDCDYLFSREKIAHYPGRKLAGQRNLLYQFEKEYDPEKVPFEVSQALEILEFWNEQKEGDYQECLKALHNWEALGLTGTLFVSGKEPLGFLVSEQLLDDTSVIHFAKAKPHIKGIYPYMYQVFARSLSEAIQWLNFEQDLGDPRLAQAKSSYHPDKLLEKFRVMLR